MPATTVLRPRSRTLIIAATVPLALAALLADDVRVRRQLDAARKDPLTGLPGRDALIAAIGHRIGAWAAARGGLAARLGGDEFGAVLLLPPTATLRETAALREELEQPVDHNGHILRPAVSIGTARAVDLPDAADASRLLRGADMAMYRVKTGEQPHGYLATRHDAYTPTVHGRRPGRPGTHLPVG